ncbi:MAG TPA: DUF2207 domain-containing protein [Anaerolineaceae bacterium]|nr:DUF2207 domain-containing protein [Anaerolineaceae bacterium]HPN51570.1 DUF2207 domain-containing protein [Anaerolineaceae bacterium]
MLRKVFLTLLVVGMLVFPRPVRAKSYYAESLNITIAIQTDGSALITEETTYVFSGGPFTYAYRDLALDKTDGIDQISASFDGQLLPEGTAPGSVEIAPGNPTRVTWHFAGTSNSRHVFSLSYRARGVIRQDNGDTLYWVAIPEDHEYDITSSLIQITYPLNLEPAAPVAVEGAAARIASEPGRVSLTLDALSSEEEIRVKLRFPAGSLVAAAPNWQQLEQEQQSLVMGSLPWGGLGAAAAALLGLAAVFGLLAKGRREGGTFVPPAVSSSIPPSNTPPGLVAGLVSSGTGYISTLYDLAGRGLLTIAQKKGSWGTTDYEITLSGALREPLRPHEQLLLEALFGPTYANTGGRVLLSKAIAKRELNPGGEFDKSVKAELAALGLWDAERATLRGWVVGLSMLGLVLAVTMGVVGLSMVFISFGSSQPSLTRLGIVLTGAGIGGFLAGMVGVIAGAVFSPRTERGDWENAAWRSFGKYLRDVAAGRELAGRPDMFSVYLAQAVSLGAAYEWSRFFKKQGVAVPGWFMAGDPHHEADGFAGFMAVSSSTYSDGGGSAGGGGGASGGGGSGAG